MVYLLLIVIGFLVPFAGLYLLPYVAMLGVGAVLFGGRRWLPAVVTAWAGVALGCVGLVAMHLSLGTWTHFMAFTRDQAGEPILRRLIAIAEAWTRGFSLYPIVGWLVLVGVVETWRTRRIVVGWREGRVVLPVWLAGILLAFTIPAAMAVAGKYPRYYGWMTFIPVLACALWEIQREASEPDRDAHETHERTRTRIGREDTPLMDTNAH